jgi:hypothetical protein
MPPAGAGSVDAVARMQMRDGDDGGAVIACEADANVTGRSRGRAAPHRRSGEKTTKDFLDALHRELAAPTPAAAPLAARDGQPAAAGEPAGVGSAPSAGAVFAPAPQSTPAREGVDRIVIAVSALTGFALALIGVAFGRWTARR